MDARFDAAALASSGAMLGILAVLGVALVVGSLTWAGATAARDRAKQARIDAFVRRAGQGEQNTVRDRRSEARRKSIQAKMRSLQENKRHSRSRLGAISANIKRAGFELTIVQFWVICGMAGLSLAALADVTHQPAWAGPAGFVLGTFLLPLFVLGHVAGKRQQEFTKYFSSAIDVMTRGLKSGLPVQECFRIVGREIPDPCGSEFRTVIDEVNAGLTMEAALERAYQRMPTQELRFFATVIAVQAQTGGNLSEILNNISGVLKGRAAMREKIKALSAEAKMSSMIVGALPFFVGGVLTAVNYAYISLLWTTQKGEFVLGLAMCLMALGVFVMNRMGKLDM
jgi:tight adherence protein B